jgi:predicted nuclease of predicted toxin-antitoxin system
MQLHWMKYAPQVCIQIVTRDADFEELIMIWRSNSLCIRIILETINIINQLPSRSRQDFNQLFGFKYDGTTQTPISGVSPLGK